MYDETSYIGDGQVYGGEQPIGLGIEDRRRHLYIVGQTGVGKSTLLRNLVIQDIEAGRGVALIDPHGDLAEELLDYYPRRRARDLVYFCPADLEHPLGFNPLYAVREDDRPLVAASIVSSLRALWPSSWGPRLEYVLYCSLISLLDAGNTTLLGVNRLLSDAIYRARITRKTKDPIVRKFWEVEFSGWGTSFVSEAVSPIQNKLGQLTTSAPIRNILGQVKPTINLRFMMDEGKVLIANLSKGKIGEDKANLLGSLLVSAFQLAALERAELLEEERRQFFLHIDEFHSFVTESFIGILSEARKYGLCLSLAHQYIDQMPEKIRHAVFGNVGTVVCFRVGARDAAILEPELAPYKREALIDLPLFHAYVRLAQDGDVLEPLRTKTHPPRGRRYGRREALIASSRERFARPREVVEGKIERWLAR